MSAFENKFKKGNKRKTEIEGSLADSLQTLVQNLGKLTEFSKRELFIISLFQAEDKYLSKMLEFLVLNKKHIKRKHAKENLEGLKYISKAVATEFHIKKLSNLFNRRNNNSDWF